MRVEKSQTPQVETLLTRTLSEFSTTVKPWQHIAANVQVGATLKSYTQQ